MGGGWAGGMVPCRMSILRNGNVALSNLRKPHVAMSNLRTPHVAMSILRKYRVACPLGLKRAVSRCQF